MGFVHVPGVGVVLPGLQMIQFNNKKSSDNKNIKDPSLKVLPIRSEGKVEVVFNQEMLIPNDFTLSMIRYVFLFSIKSDADGSVTYGRVVDGKELSSTQSAGKRSRLLQEKQNEAPLVS